MFELFQDNKKWIFSCFGGVLAISIIAFLLAPDDEYSFKGNEAVNVQKVSFSDELFSTVPEEVKKEETLDNIEEDLEEEELEVDSPKLDPRHLISQEQKKLKARDILGDTNTEKHIEELRARIYLSKLYRQPASQVWIHEKRFEEQFKNTPIEKLKRERKKVQSKAGTFGNTEEFCDKGEDCLTATKPTNAEEIIIAGTSIPVVLSQTIVSDIPSPICSAQVTQDITGFQGNYVLIPKNSIANCKVVAVTSPEQERLQLIFTDIFTPNGTRIKGEFAGTDMTGAEGIGGEVDTRLMERVGFPIATAAIPVTVAYTLPKSQTESEDRMNAAVQGISQAVQPIIQKEFDRNLKTMPRITVRAGEIMNIKPLENLVFKRDENGQFMPTWQQ